MWQIGVRRLPGLGVGRCGPPKESRIRMGPYPTHVDSGVMTSMRQRDMNANCVRDRSALGSFPGLRRGAISKDEGQGTRASTFSIQDWAFSRLVRSYPGLFHPLAMRRRFGTALGRSRNSSACVHGLFTPSHSRNPSLIVTQPHTGGWNPLWAACDTRRRHLLSQIGSEAMCHTLDESPIDGLDHVVPILDRQRGVQTGFSRSSLETISTPAQVPCPKAVSFGSLFFSSGGWADFTYGQHSSLDAYEFLQGEAHDILFFRRHAC